MLNKRIIVTIVEFGTGTAGAEGDKGSDPWPRKLFKEKLDQNFPTQVSANIVRLTVEHTK